jgi:hypothetical protein
MLRVVLIIVLLGIYIASIIDVIRTPSAESRRLPRFVWLLIVVVIPVIGGVLWGLLGRVWPQRGRRRKQISSPDDDAKFLRQLDEEAWKRKMRERRDEGEDKGRDDDSPEPATS